MAANGLLADRNRVPAAIVDETGWSALAPAALAKTLPLRMAGRSLKAGTAAAPVVLRGKFTGRQVISVASLLATNCRQANAVRYRLWADDQFNDVAWDSSAYTGLDRKMMPALYDWRQLRWGAPNLYRGDLDPEDFGLYPGNIHMLVPQVRAAAWEWQIIGPGIDRATGQDVDYIEVGHAWSSDALQFRTNYSQGREDGWNPSDEIKRTAGGGVYVEPGTGYRTVQIPFNHLRLPDGNRLTDLTRRVGFGGPVLWLPGDDAAENFRYGFLGQRRDQYRKSRRFFGFDASTIQLEEITT